MLDFIALCEEGDIEKIKQVLDNKEVDIFKSCIYKLTCTYQKYNNIEVIKAIGIE